MLTNGTILQGHYRIIRLLGEGGCGRVYQAIDNDLKRNVAIKERRADRNSEELRPAFKREAQLLANLDWPILPKVHEHFFVEREQYIVMELIEGDDLAKLLKDRKRPFAVEEVLPWADKVLEALEYLHNRSVPIIHCDIKPSNIKLTDKGQIFLLDFGLAQGAAGQMSTHKTNPSVPVGTPGYAPLEQRKLEATYPQSDIYSVGATLYHLLTDQLPCSPLQRDEDIQHGHGDPLKRAHEVNPAIPTSISEIISQALAVYWRDRIESASKMRTMLEQAQQKIAYEPPPTALQQGRRWWLALGLAALLLASLALLVGYNFFSEPKSVGGKQISGAPMPSPPISPERIVKATPATLSLKHELEGHTATVWAVAFSPDGSLLASASADGAIILWDTKTWEHKEPLRGHEGDVYSLSFSPDGQTLASASKDKTIKLWDARTGQLSSVRLPTEHTGEVLRVAYSPNGQLLASTGKDRTLRLWYVNNGWKSKLLAGHMDEVRAIAFSPDGKTLASTGYDKKIIVRDLQSGAEVQQLNTGTQSFISLAFSPDGQYLICGGEGGAIKRWTWQAQDGKWKELDSLKYPADLVNSLAVSPDSKLLVSAGKDNRILLWDLQSGASTPLDGKFKRTWSVAFSLDGQTLISGGEDKIIRVWQ